jgi:hypothetical protein
MQLFERTRLWQRSLAAQLDPDPNAALRARLREALERFRGRAALLAQEIARDLPDFTVHDISHIDALWEMSELIAGPDYPLNPAEAFVLGGAFLVHDLGLGLAAYPKGIADLQNNPLWKDTAAAELRQRQLRPDTLQSNWPADLARTVTAVVLRALHAEHAERLATLSWEGLSGSRHFLIEDSDLRDTYGPVIGRIAQSHWWATNRIPTMFSANLGAPGGYPNDWTVDAIKLACLLRSADVIHLDERRAPAFLAAIRQPEPEARKHWIFQQKLYQPRREADRLVFTAKSAFTIDEREAWWLCFDTLQIVDRELRDVDSVITDTNRPRLTARSVAYAQSPEALSRLVPVEGWRPIDTRIRVTGVAEIVSSLGGENLYGPNLQVPLRELIQNAADAIRARRAVESRESAWGQVTVRVGSDEQGEWIECEDTGVGMSSTVLAGPLLDFGNSFWGSPLMHTEFPGLESKDFTATGKYGIGFFSVFMWGNRVRVTSRRYDTGQASTWILEFENGLTGRPYLRPATPTEFIRDGGTKVRVWLKTPEILRHLLERGPKSRTWNLPGLCSWLCPALDVDLAVTEPGQSVTMAIRANDWLAISGADLLHRLVDEDNDTHPPLAVLGEFLEKLDASGPCLGRVAVTPRSSVRRRPVRGVVTVGGFRATTLSGLAGVLVGDSSRAARDIAIPQVDIEDLADFATRQALRLSKLLSDPEQLEECAATIRMLGGATGPLPIAQSARGWRTFNDIVLDVAHMREVVLVQNATLSIEERENKSITLNDNVLAVEVGQPGILQGTRYSRDWLLWPSRALTGDNAYWDFHAYTLEGLAVEAIAQAWKVSPDEVVENAVWSDEIGSDSEDDTGRKVPVGLRGAGIVYLRGDLIRRP